MTAEGTSFWTRWKSRLWWLSVLSLSCLVLIVTFQNIASVETRVLFWTLALPRVVLLIIAAGIGFVLGAIWGRSRS